MARLARSGGLRQPVCTFKASWGAEARYSSEVPQRLQSDGDIRIRPRTLWPAQTLQQRVCAVATEQEVAQLLDHWLCWGLQRLAEAPSACGQDGPGD